ncbi:MAG TPA: glycine cleavage system protein H [Casimicrobiaceae bacterium]|nr:glycine cleavage system protein H [Casimicrobiaceae bacterium]
MVSIRGFEFPDDLLYLVEHDTWARLEASGEATIGITSLGAYISGDFIEFMARPVGEVIERERAFGMLEMSKVIRSARSPIAGTITAINDRVRSAPTLINTDPYGAGWLVRMRPSAWDSDICSLVTGASIAPAVESYMALLSESFGEAPP